MAYDYELLSVTKTGRLGEVIISNPPINLITQQLFEEWMALAEELEADSDLTVILFKSADPDFFMAHFDVELILSFPVDRPAERSTDPNPFHVMCQRFRSMDKVTIAQVEGRVGGGGNEIISNMDMRFGVRGKTIINQMEVPLGILPGGTGTQNLSDIIGHGRAMEVILGGEDLDAETAERWGYLNRNYAAEDIDGKVRALAQRIAGFPVEAVRFAKQSINNAAGPSDKGLAEESFLFQQLIRTPDARSKMQQFLDIGGQTRDGELQLDSLVNQLKNA